MLLWESLSVPTEPASIGKINGSTPTVRTLRLPYDKRCTALTKSGTRCRGRIRPGREFCLFHDPEMTAERRRRMAAKAAQSRRRLTHLPDGYLRKLTSVAAVGQAMDRLYREVRLGVITPEMGKVLFGILTRLLDNGLVATGPCPERSRAARIRPKLRDLLTRAERVEWAQAVANASTLSADVKPKQQLTRPFERAVANRKKPHQGVAAPAALTFQAAS